MTLTIMVRSTLCKRLPWLAIGLLLATLSGCSGGCSKDGGSAVTEETSQASSTAAARVPRSRGAIRFAGGQPTPSIPKAAINGAQAAADYDPVSISTDADTDSGGAPLTVTFTAEVHGGPPGLRYRWEFGDKTPPVEQLRARHTYQRPGEYTATFSVTGVSEINGDQSSDIDIAVTEEGFDFDIETDSDVGAAPLTVEFTARLDEDLPGPFNFQWDFGDGARDVSNPTTHTYRNPGEYTATVTVTNAQGQQATRDVDITVDAPDDTAEEDQ